MSTSISGLQQLMAPWLTGANPSSVDNGLSDYGGYQGLISALMQGAGPDTPQARTGAALQKAQAQALENAKARQGLAQGSIGIQQSAAMFPYLINALQRYGRGAQGNPSQPAAGSPQPDYSGTPPMLRDPNAPASQFVPPQQQPSQQGGPDLQSGLDLSRVLAIMKSDPASLMKSFEVDPAYTTANALAKDPLTLDRAMMSEAQQSGDKDGYQAAYFKYLEDSHRVSVDRYGNVTTLGGISPRDLGVNTFLPTQGIETSGGVASVIPGITNTKSQMAAAEESGKVRGATAPLGGTGGAAPPDAPAKSPAASQVQGAAAVNTDNYIPPVLSAPANIRPQTGSAGGAAVEKFQGDQATHAASVISELSEQSKAAQDITVQTRQIRDAAQLFGSGRFADGRAEMMNVLNSMGLLSPDQQRQFGAYQEGQKLSIQMQALVTKALGSREAAQVFSTMGKSVPGMTLSEDGLERISAYLDGVSKYKIAQNTFAARLNAQQNINGLNSLEQNFQSHSDPTFYILASASPQVRKEMLTEMPQTVRQNVLLNWDRAIKAGLAPKPSEYLGQ